MTSRPGSPESRTAWRTRAVRAMQRNFLHLFCLYTHTHQLLLLVFVMMASFVLARVSRHRRTLPCYPRQQTNSSETGRYTASKKPCTRAAPSSCVSALSWTSVGRNRLSECHLPRMQQKTKHNMSRRHIQRTTQFMYVYILHTSSTSTPQCVAT